MKEKHFDNHLNDKLQDYSSPVPDGLWDKVSAGNFDHLFSSKLGNHASAVPDGLWEKIMPQDTKRKPVFYWFTQNAMIAALLIVAVLLGGGYFWWNQSTPSLSLTNSKAVTETSTVASSENPVKAEAQVSNDKENEAVSTGTNAEEGAFVESSTSIKKTLVEKEDKPEQFFKGKINQQEKSVVKREISGSEKQNDEKQNSLMLQSNNNGEIEGWGDVNSYAVDQTFSLSHKSNGVLWKQQLQSGLMNHKLTNAKVSGLPVIGCPTSKGPEVNDLFLEVYAAPNYVEKIITPAYGISDNYLRLKDSTESIRTSYSAGIRLSKTLGTHFSIKAGLHYSQVNETMRYRIENEVRFVTVVTIRNITLPDGTTTTISDTSVVQQIGYRDKTTYNRYRSIDLPLLLSYEFGGSKLRGALTFGPIINLYSWYNGEMLDTSFQFISLKGDDNRKPFKNNIGVGLYAGLSLIGNINETTNWFVEPYARYNLGNMTTNSYLFTQRFTSYGINIGIRKRLFSLGKGF